jgi:hypothetical protein
VARTQLALALGLMMPTAAVANPVVLNDAQMDRVTAGGLLIDVASVATALGANTYTHTDADTYLNLAQHFGIGLTIGEAFACCGPDSQVQVGSTVFADGGPAYGTTHSSVHEGVFLAYGFSVGILLVGGLPQYLPVYQDAIASFHDGLVDLSRAGPRNQTPHRPRSKAASLR